MITMEEKMKSSVFFIEANSFEVLKLWEEYKDTTNWIEDKGGFSQIIGYIDEPYNTKPVNISFTFAKIFGERICFYDVVSRFSDHSMVEEYLKTNYPVTYDNGNRIAITNAMNFHHTIEACKQ